MKSFEISWNHYGFSKIVLDFMKSIMKSYDTKDETYVCIHAPFTHTCTTKYHQNVRYTQLAFPLYSTKHQVIMRDLCWTTCFCCFSVKSRVSWKAQCFSWKVQCFSVKSTAFHHANLWALGLSPSIWSFFRKTKHKVGKISFITHLLTLDLTRLEFFLAQPYIGM